MTAESLGGRQRASGRSLDTFGDAALVWSDVFLLGQRFECGYGEAAVAERLARLGFVAIDPLAMTVPEQVRAFAAAEMVAGIGGAGMFNTVFCRPGTKVLSVGDSPTFLGMHANLFASLGHEYGFVLGVHAPESAPGKLRWHADPAAVEAAARRFFGLAQGR